MFTSAQFTSTEFYSASEKARFANFVALFVTAGYPRKLFTRWFYKLLSGNAFGMIAEFDIDIFYRTHFSTTARKVDFIEQCVSWQFYGQVEFTFADVEKSLQSWLTKTRVLEKLRCQLADELGACDRADHATLHAKYGGV